MPSPASLHRYDEFPVPAPAAARQARAALILLFLANLLNFYDRFVPGLLGESIKREFGLGDAQWGLTASLATIVYAVAGIPLGRLADRANRFRVLGWGLGGWSLLTALNGLMPTGLSFAAARCAVGMGEASCAPAANSLVADLFPVRQRGRAAGVLQLGLPLGMVAASFTVGPIAQASGSWRLPFFLAAVPGCVVALALFRGKEPLRGSADEAGADLDGMPPVHHPVRAVLAIPTMRWIALAGAAYNFVLTAVATFLAPLLQRYFELPLAAATMANGLITGATGVAGLLVGGWLADRARRKSERGRLAVGAWCLLLSAPAAGAGLLPGQGSTVVFAIVFGVAMFLLFAMFSPVYASIYDVVEPRLRGTAMAVFFIGMYVLGAAAGPYAVGALSDAFARASAGTGQLATTYAAHGLHQALFLVCPAGLLLAAACLWRATSYIRRDAAYVRGESLWLA